MYGYGGGPAPKAQSEMMTLAPYVTDKKPVPVKLIHDYINVLRTRTAFLDPNDKLVPVCLDLAHYRDRRLSGYAIQIINRHYTQVYQLFDRGATATILICKESVNDFREITKCLLELRHLALSKLDGSQMDQVKR